MRHRTLLEKIGAVRLNHPARTQCPAWAAHPSQVRLESFNEGERVGVYARPAFPEHSARVRETSNVVYARHSASGR
jgi:hypothetical protein